MSVDHAKAMIARLKEWLSLEWIREIIDGSSIQYDEWTGTISAPDSSGIVTGGTVGELEDLTVKTGSFKNAGAGWNTFEFPGYPFEGVPMVTCEAEGFAVEVKSVTPEGFLYRLVAGSSPSLDVSKGSYFVHTSKATSTSSMSQVSLVTGISLASDGAATTSEAVEVKYMAIEYGGDE